MINITLYETLPSTNTLLKELAAKGEPEGRVIIAKSQTEGRGRMGRSFYSPENTGLYMSILLRPSDFTDISLLTPLAAVATAESIEEISGIETSVKWVNDIYISGKKVCGILTEGSVSAESCYAIIGIGVNLKEPEGGFPKEISDIAGAVFKKAPEDAFFRLYTSITEKIFRFYKEFKTRSFIGEYIKRCTYLNGKEVALSKGSEIFRGVVTGVDENCRLIIKDSSGKSLYFNSGEANILKQPL